MKVVYKVMVRIRAGIDDCMDCEYNGKEYDQEADAERCLKTAKQDVAVNNRLILAYIDRIEVIE